MKQLLLSALLLVGLAAQAQQILGKLVAEYTTKQGTTFHPGDTLHFALGKRNDGTFRYAETLPSLMFSGGPLGLTWSNVPGIIKELKQQELRNTKGTRTVAVFKAGASWAAVDLESAEQAGEISTKANQQAAAPPAAVGGSSVADELLKLKKLFDAGVLTQAEFDAQKAKLLSR